MSYRIPLMRHALINEANTLRALAVWLEAEPDRLSMGEQCAEFERQFAKWQHHKHCTLFNSGSSANLALWQAVKNLGFPAGKRVGFSALTWPTNVMPLMQLGYTPHAIDVDPSTLNITPRTLQKELHKLDALFVTNALGICPDLDVIAEMCRESRIPLYEDNCEGLGSELLTDKAGNFGEAATFSFFVAHHMSTIEGGAVCTDDDALAEMLIMVRSNGWDRNLPRDRQEHWRKSAGVDDFDGAYTFYAAAYNMRPTEITGFLGLEQLKHLDTNLDKRSLVFLKLTALARMNNELLPLDTQSQLFLSPFAFPVVCKSRGLRTKYIARLAAAGVETRPIIAGNITRQPFYRDIHPDMPPLYGADMIHECGFYFGIWPEMGDEEIVILSECLKEVQP